MLTFDIGKKRFNFRAVGVIIHNDRILLHTFGDPSFWALPGGRVEFGESASATVIREMQEEIGASCEIDRLLWVVENFFTHENKRYHEHALFFLLSFPSDSELFKRGDEFFAMDQETRLNFKWFRISDIDGLELYPSFLRQHLKLIPQTTEYIIHSDN